MYEKIMRWYHLGLWTKQMVLNAIEKNVITAEEAKNIIEEESR